MSSFHVNPEIPLDEASRLFDAVQPRINQMLTQKSFLGATAPPMVDGGQGRPVPYTGHIPSDLTAIDDNGLGWYLGMLSTWLDYVQTQLAEASGNMTVAEAKMEFIEAHLLMVHKKDNEGKKRPENERKSMVLIDRRYVEAQAEHIYHETYYRYVKAIASSAEQNYASISRRITQRQQDIERQKRTNGVGAVTPGPMFRQPIHP